VSSGLRIRSDFSNPKGVREKENRWETVTSMLVVIIIIIIIFFFFTFINCSL
jgi:heme/copper-type cytochrome/quinol oxidase subunit 2